VSDIVVQLLTMPSALGLPLPTALTAGAAGSDLISAEDIDIPPGGVHAVATGIALAIPNGFEGQVRPRSGLALKHAVTVLNAPGTIDSDYRGEVKVILINHGKAPFRIVRGDRIAQLVVAPVVPVHFERVNALPDTARGSGGFGSTGLNLKSGS
jgi:dUTP pyrophosphatase